MVYIFLTHLRSRYRYLMKAFMTNLDNPRSQRSFSGILNKVLKGLFQVFCCIFFPMTPKGRQNLSDIYDILTESKKGQRTANFPILKFLGPTDGLKCC